jgi:hypothetical protein
MIYDLQFISDGVIYQFMQAFMNDMNKGCGCSTVDEYSGWNCVPMYHFRDGTSTISTRFVSGLMPTHFMPAASYSF